MKDVYRLINHEQRVHIAGYEIFIINNPSFVQFLRDPLSDNLSSGVQVCDPGRTIYTYGAGPCVAGITLLEKPHLFHIGPMQFEEPIEAIDQAQWGLIGGSIHSFGASHQVVLSDKYLRKDERPFNVAISNLGENKLRILYGQSF
jgi:hypothetical protein